VKNDVSGGKRSPREALEKIASLKEDNIAAFEYAKEIAEEALTDWREVLPAPTASNSFTEEQLERAITASKSHAVSGRDAVDILHDCVSKYPELRVGQILIVATGTIDHFNLENDVLARKLNEFLWGRK